ncbi:Gti1/Pac2 family-domain-containing protein, partial [Peziza echinospora]
MPQHSPRSSIGSDDMRPTVEAQILDTKDALILVQRCLESKLFPITRRPHDRERAYLVKAGNVFIYTEEVSGIKRWTDGINWSPSRILNNFLVYRELEHAFPPGEKKKATKRTKRYDPYSRDRDRAHQLMNHHLNPPNHETIHVAGASRALTREEERLLVGSLNESYSFKHDGLIKKTISLNFQGQTWHIVWYFTYFAHIDGHFTRPSERWPETIIHPGLIQEQNFRCP